MTLSTLPITPIDEYTTTDLGNARRFADQHGWYARYCHVWKKWLIFDGELWVEDETGKVFRLARETVMAIYKEASDASDASQRKAIADHAKRSEAAGSINAMVNLARSEHGIPVILAELDADPYKFNLQNGTIDLLTGELKKHNRKDLITKIAEVIFDPDAESPMWESFLDRIFSGNQHIIRFLQRAVGYSLSGCIDEQCLFILWGTGRNGKSTLIETIRALVGDYGMAAGFSTFTLKGNGIRNDIARLKGARMVAGTEGSDGARFDESLIKQLTGGDTIAARKLYSEFFEFKPTFKIWLATNHKPRIGGTDLAIWRRVHLIPFNVTIPEEEQDRELPSKLLAELPGILNWALRGCLEWRQEGLIVPDAVRAATKEYREEEDQIAPFITDCCVVRERVTVSAKAIYGAYVNWCEVNGERVLPKRSFGQRLGEKGFDQHKGTGGQRQWIGIGLQAE